MGKFRIYPSKSNTIASSPAYEQYNSSQNQVANLWYGGGIEKGSIYRENSISRHLIYFDLSELASKMSNFDINPNYITTYTLNLTNAIPKEVTLEKEFTKNVLRKSIASSFDLIAFPVNMSWDEGRGYDIFETDYLVKSAGNIRLSGYSNWINSTSQTAWTQPGVFSNPTASTTFNAIQHFQMGSENINMDITSIVNNWLSGGSSNYGICIAYSRPFELLSSDTRYLSSFYTSKTNSAFKPYIEVNYDQVINDDRNQVTNNRMSRLFLYLFSGNTPVNYFSAGTVSIKNSSNIDVHTNLTPVHHSKGVYYVDVWMSGTTRGQKFKDVWNGVSINPVYDQQNITQNFEIKDNFYSSNARDVNNYAISTYGIDNNSIIQTDEVYRIYIDSRLNYSNIRPFVNYGLEYKLSMNNNFEVIPWTTANSSVINGIYKSFIDIDTSWLLNHQNYEISFRVNDLGTKVNLKEIINFRIENNIS